MSSQITKFGLLSFLSTALAAPFYPSGYSAGTGAPYGLNTTGPYAPTGSGASTGFSYTATETLTETLDVTETSVSTVYYAATSASVAAAAVSTGVCGPETITVTASTAVTVTVTPGYVAPVSASSVAAAAFSSSSPIASSHKHGHHHSSRSSEAAAPSSAAAYSAPAYSAPVVSSVYVPASSVVSSVYVPASSVVSSVYVPASSVVSSVYVPASSVVVPVSSVAAASTPAAYSSAVVASSVVPSSVAASSSAVASSASTPVSGGNGKRGLAYNTASLTTCFEDKSAISWAYNWAQVSDGLSSAFEYVPMLIDLREMFTSTWEANWKKALAAGSTSFLSFNEPDLSTQANLSPAVAATNHITYMNPIKAAGGMVGSPAVTNGGTGMGLDWLNSFKTACAGACDYDFVVIHWYDSATNIQYFKDHVTQAHTDSGKPVWVTEFGATGSDAEISTFLQEVMSWMDGQSFVQKYAYFMVEEGVLISGTEPSTIGTVYASSS